MVVRSFACLVALTTIAAAAPLSPQVRASHERAIDALPGAAISVPLRTTIDVAYGVVPAARTAAWRDLIARHPGLTEATWDRATAVPSRIWGRGPRFPGSVADPAIAAAAAWRTLAEHLPLLAPGAAITDFELVANDLDGGLRTIGFEQRHRGVPVWSGQVSFRFKADRLFVIGSEAAPDVAVTWPRAARRAADLVTAAAAATAGDLALDPRAIAARADGELEIVPLIGDHRVLGYRVAQPVHVDAGASGAWRVWVDPDSGAPVLRVARSRTATGTAQVLAVTRYPGRPRAAFAPIQMQITVDGAATTTDDTGAFSWPGTAAATVTLSPTGPGVRITNAAGTTATLTRTLAPGGTLDWDPSAEVDVDAQVSAFVHAEVVRRYARRFAPDLAYLDRPIVINVNIGSECNANSNGEVLNFFAASDRCENTARIADVVYHEYGHSIHFASIIRGVGFFDGAFSEGLSDYVAATITGDSGMGRGFFRTDAALRELDPPDSEAIWPRDIAEIHKTGVIFGGAMWDLRKALIAELGEDAGVRTADRLFYAAVRRASSIPSTLVEILAADDDDGDLTNGTPHECTIRSAFARHGLRTIKGDIDAPGTHPSAVVDAQPVRLTLTGRDERCGDEITSVKVEWREGQIAPGTTDATADGDQWTAPLPVAVDGAALYFRFRVRYRDGSESLFPDNRADPWYQQYHGDVVVLYCTDFERNPLADGWRVGGTAPAVWQWGQAGGHLGVGDPTGAYSGQRLIGTGLSFIDATYPADASTWLESPVIDVGAYSDVHLFYRRWLNVEDGFYDQATIEVNGERAWANMASTGSGSHTTHHQDKAWVFQDVPLSSRIHDGTVAVRWTLDTDEGFELGGWNLDDVCVVANPRAVCGDGTKTRTEQCDDGAGNGTSADQCRPWCRLATCGDGITDTAEECDDGDDDDDDACSTLCLRVEERPDRIDGGCAAGPGASAGLGVALAALVIRRRRRGASRARAA